MSTFARLLTGVRITFYGPVYEDMVSMELLTTFHFMYEELKYCVKVHCATGSDGPSQQNGGMLDVYEILCNLRQLTC